MSTRRTRGNPNPRRIANVPPPNVSIPNEDAPQPTIETPSSTTTVAPIHALATNLALAATFGSSSLILNQVDTPIIEDFGRDKDLKNLLKNLQPKAFT